MNRHLHIVAFDIPAPPDYGGVIDIYYKVSALAAAGISIHLHCFQYHRKPSPALESICASVHYYHRNINKTLLFNKLPYIVVSRRSEELSRQLRKDDYPVLLEGLHCTAFLDEGNHGDRKIFVRTHNVEHEYYHQLGLTEKNPFKRFYFFTEATKLEAYEPVLRKASGIAAISLQDAAHFRGIHPKTVAIPAFHAYAQVESREGKGNYAIYHGSLSVGENNRAALYLVNEVFNDLGIPFVIAGNHPSRELREAVNKNPYAELRSNLAQKEMQTLLRDAHVHVLPTFQQTGIKLKLLNALFSGRHCIVNSEMVKGTGLERLCDIADDAAAMKEAVLQIMKIEMTGMIIEKRKKILEKFSAASGVDALCSLIWGAP